MRTISELARKKVELSTDPNTTKMATTYISSMLPTKWVTEIIKYSEEVRMLEQLVYVNKEMVGTNLDAITVPKTTSHKSITTSPIDTTYPEGTVRNFTIMDNVGVTTFTIANTDFLKGGISIGKEVYMTCALDLVAQAKFTIAQDMADDVDLALATALQSTSITNVVWGGDSTQVEDLEDGDVITTDLAVDGRRMIRTNKFKAKYMVISSYQEATFLKDSQFVNASEYGSNEVIMKGEIGTYLGMKIIVTDNANFAYTSGDTEVNENASPGASCNVCPIIGVNSFDQPSSVGLAWKELPHIDYEYEKNEARHLIYYDQCFTTGLIHADAICLIKVTQT
jgi:N4-gp56 family major capsid protein